MYNTTFCLNSQSLAFFFVVFLLHLHNSYTLGDGDVFPQNINLIMLIMHLNLCVLCMYILLNACVFARVWKCVRMCIEDV